MTTFRFTASAQGGQEKQMCSYPIGLDPYRSGCKNNCSYCYVRHRLQDLGSWKLIDPSKLDIAHLSSIFEKVFEKGKIVSVVDRILASRLPLRIGMNTDPFQEIEKVEGITYALLKLLKDYNYPYTLLTKNCLIADEKYLPLYSHDISYLQITITSLNEDISAKIEQGASHPQERLNAVKNLVKAGLRVAVRINPLFPIYQDGHFTDGSANNKLDELKVFSWDLVEQICQCKPSTVIAGFLRVESEKSHRWIQKETGMDLRPYFWKYPNHKYYSKEEINYYYEKVQAICDKHKIPFTVCYDRDENYEYFKHMWTNPDDCCNGLKKTSCFSKTYKMVNRE